MKHKALNRVGTRWLGERSQERHAVVNNNQNDNNGAQSGERSHSTATAFNAAIERERTSDRQWLQRPRL